jgi:pimeloyl-ACP methyl ester carboxylesterase
VINTSLPRPLDLIAGLRGPVLAFWGDQDETVGIETVEQYVAAAPTTLAHPILPGLGHGFLIDADFDSADDDAALTWRETIELLRENANRRPSQTTFPANSAVAGFWFSAGPNVYRAP